MQKIMFNDRFGLTQAVLEGRKTMTRRIATTEGIECPNIGWGIEGKERGKRVLCSCNEILAMSRYAKGDLVAIAQAYKDVNCGGYPVDSRYDSFRTAYSVGGVREYDKGWNNKMFVYADLMPHHIKITNIHVERLQDISEDDCLKEGIKPIKSENVPQINETGVIYYTFEGVTGIWTTPREAFAALIDKVSGKGTWSSNPYCFCYTFKLID